MSNHYRARECVVALQFTEDVDAGEIDAFMTEAGLTYTLDEGDPAAEVSRTLAIETDGGTEYVPLGHYIVLCEDMPHRTVSADEFDAIYEHEEV